MIRSDGAVVAREEVTDVLTVWFHTWCARECIHELMLDARPPLQGHVGFHHPQRSSVVLGGKGLPLEQPNECLTLRDKGEKFGPDVRREFIHGPKNRETFPVRS